MGQGRGEERRGDKGKGREGEGEGGEDGCLDLEFGLWDMEY